MRMITEAFVDTLELGLEKPEQVVVRVHILRTISSALIALSQPMIPTFVFGWPSGEERGDYLALDLGVF